MEKFKWVLLLFGETIENNFRRQVSFFLKRVIASLVLGSVAIYSFLMSEKALSVFLTTRVNGTEWSMVIFTVLGLLSVFAIALLFRDKKTEKENLELQELMLQFVRGFDESYQKAMQSAAHSAAYSAAQSDNIGHEPI